MSNDTEIEDIYSYCDSHKSIIALLHQVLYAIICLVGLFGNSLVIYVVLRFSKMQTVTNRYILNLAIADECFLIGIPFLVTTVNLEKWVFGKFMCTAYMVTTSINQFTSSLFLLIMSADRYVAVCHPISSPKFRTNFISCVVSCVVWTASVIFMTPVFLYATTTENPSNGRVSCNIYWPENHGGHAAFTLYTFLIGFAIPLLLIFIFYSLVIRKLRNVGPKNKSKEKKRSNRKVTKLVLTVITVYVACWLPYWVTQMALIYTEPNQCQSSLSVSVFLLAGVLSYSNSAMNPILYAFLSDNFKKSFLKAFKCVGAKDSNVVVHENSVLNRRNKAIAEKLQSNNLEKANQSDSKNEEDEEENERGLLISKASSTTVTMTSRSNVTVVSDQSKDKDVVKNGVSVIQNTEV